MFNGNFSNTANDTFEDNLDYMPVIGLTIGMKVAKLDKPWTDSAFLLQGFTIKSESDINALRAECHHVYIETQERFMGSSMYRGNGKSESFDWAKPPGGRVI